MDRPVVVVAATALARGGGLNRGTRNGGGRAARVDQLGSPATRGSLTEREVPGEPNVQTNVRIRSLSLFLLESPLSKQNSRIDILFAKSLSTAKGRRDKISVEGVKGDKRRINDTHE